MDAMLRNGDTVMVDGEIGIWTPDGIRLVTPLGQDPAVDPHRELVARCNARLRHRLADMPRDVVSEVTARAELNLAAKLAIMDDARQRNRALVEAQRGSRAAPHGRPDAAIRRR